MSRATILHLKRLATTSDWHVLGDHSEALCTVAITNIRPQVASYVVRLIQAYVSKANYRSATVRHLLADCDKGWTIFDGGGGGGGGLQDC